MLKKLLCICCGFFLGLTGYSLLLLYAYQDALLFKSRPLKGSHLFTSKHPLEEIFLQGEKNASIHALLFKTPSPLGVVVYFHGRGGNLASRWGDVAEDFLSRSYDVLIMDYRGFGKSRGPLSEQALFDDASLVYEYAAERYGTLNTIIYGRSLGTGIATYVAAQYPTPLVILEAPYFSMRDLVSLKFPLIPKFLFSFLLKYPLRTDHWIQSVSSHIELFHGTSDTLIPCQSSELLYKLASHKNPHAHLTIIPGGTHNNLSYSQAYQNRVDELLKLIKKS